MPAVPYRIEGRSVSPGEKCRGLYDLVQTEHLITAQEVEQVINAADMNIIQDEQRPGFKMWVQAVVFEVREWICMRAINDRKLEFLGEMVLRERTLRRAVYKRNYTLS